MDLARLRLFVQVADAGSLSKVAVLHDAVQSAISRQISALEREYGGRLFDRTGRGVALTERGRRLYPEVRALLAEADRVEALLRGSDELPLGEVRLGLMPSVAELLVAQLFGRARERFPEVRLRLLEGSNGQLDGWIATGHLDAAVLYRYGQHTRPLEDPLFDVQTFLVGPPGDPLTSAPAVPFSALDGLPLVLPGEPNGLRVALNQIARRQPQGFRLNPVLEADSLPIQRSMASHGHAYAIHGGVVVRRDVQAGVVSAAPLVEPGIRRTMVLATTTQRPMTRATREIQRLIRQIADEHVRAGSFEPPTSGEVAAEAQGPDQKS
jgi:LysR family transcriptional regulator, nitrogen assimilation regulatory protein